MSAPIKPRWTAIEIDETAHVNIPEVKRFWTVKITRHGVDAVFSEALSLFRLAAHGSEWDPVFAKQPADFATDASGGSRY